MNLLWILVIVIVIVALVGSPIMGPHVGWSHNYGWGPSGIGIILVIVLVVVLLRGA